MRTDPTIFTEKRCGRCKVMLPIDSFSLTRSTRDGHSPRCRTCDSARGRKYRADNREVVRARAATYNREHPEQLRASAARFRARHPDRVLAGIIRYRDAHPEWLRAYRRLAAARHRALVMGVFVEDVDVMVLVERDHGRCGICGKPVVPKNRSVDHIIPVSRGGEHSYRNTRLAHRRCNSRRGNRGSAQIRMVG